MPPARRTTATLTVVAASALLLGVRNAEAPPAPEAGASTGPVPPAAARPAAPAAPPAVAGGLSAAIPVVAFPSVVPVVRGRLRTPVLLADPTVTATAHVVGTGSRPGCRVDLHQGAPGWLDCAVGRLPTRIDVALSDGRVVHRVVR